MLLNKQERRQKEYLALEREYNKLLEAERNLPWTEVKPYQDGWFIYIDFRDEVKRRADYPHLSKALEVVHRRGRTRNPKLVNKIRNTKRLDQVYNLFKINKWGDQYTWYGNLSQEYGDYMRRSDYWYYYSCTPPVLARCHPDTYKHLHPSTQKWLYKVVDNTKYWGDKEWYKSCIPEHFLKVKVKPAYVTHVKDIDPQLMKRKAEISIAMDTIGYRYGWYYTGRGDSWESRFVNRRRRVHDRASLRKIIKGESEDFEYIRKNKAYD